MAASVVVAVDSVVLICCTSVVGFCVVGLRISVVSASLDGLVVNPFVVSVGLEGVSVGLGAESVGFGEESVELAGESVGLVGKSVGVDGE